MGTLGLTRRLVTEARRYGRQTRRARLQPPQCPAGWRCAPPDFVGVGVQKAGTSWWFSLLVSHPEVFYAESLPKELHYFGRFWSDPFTPQDAAAYTRFFPRPETGIAGEWTPRYITDFWTPQLLAAAAPLAKILVLLRDPVERYRSGVTHELALGAAPHPGVAHDAFVRGFYFQQLSRLLEHVPRQRLLVLQYERCLADSPGELERTYRFLGLREPGWLPEGMDRRVNETKVDKLPLDDRLRRQLVNAYRDDVQRLLDAFPEVDRELWPNFR